MPELYDVRLITMVTPSLRARIEEHRWSARLASMSDAVRDLIERGLDGQPSTPARGQAAASPAPAAPPAALPTHVGPLPTVKVPDSEYAGAVPMVVNWLNRAIQTEKRATFTENELFIGAWSKGDGYALTTGDRKAVTLAMKATGWRRSTQRAGRAPGDPLHTWSAPEIAA